MIRHTSCGIWELYEDVRPKARQWMSLHSVRSAIDGLPYVWRMFVDVARIPGIWPLLGSYLVVVLILSVLPAVTLVCNASLLSIVQTAVDRRTIEEHVLLRAVVGLVLCSAGAQLFNHFKGRLTTPLNSRIKSHYSVHIFASMVRLDVPTFNDPAVQRLLEQTCTLHSHSTVAFIAISAALDFASSLIRITSQISVLIAVLRNYPDAFFLVCLSCTSALYKLTRGQHVLLGNSDLWVATTTNKDFIRSEGLKRAASDHVHRKEIVAGGIAPFLLSQYHKSMTTLFDCVMNFFEAVYMNPDRRRPIWDIILQEFLHTLPQVIFALRAVHQPTSIPVSLASFNVVTTTTQSFVSAADSLIQSLGSLSYHILSVRQLYEVAKIPNRIKVQSVYEKTDADETFIGTPFPEDDKTLVHGISVEFRDVSFIYPGNTAYALRHVSFKLERGQLCVIVGNNGSGKSTILKLISRLYDPTEGTILVDGVDIKTLRLADLRRCVSVLFQDYTLFPLSIHDNIALGDPTHADDRDKVERAAQLGGADAFIERLPEKYDTYLERPIRDFYSPHAEGTPNPSDGSIVDFTALRAAAGISQTSTDGAGGGVGNKGLSGGQMQRIALSRMFMRSVVSDESVGLLLFDEPSASLDPTAEHDLFERLRTLRGNKTMVFSTHRFGNLTRYADRILYMDDSRIVEEGTHDELIAHGGEYARIWMLQARAFL